MADGIPVTPGEGMTVASEEINDVQWQAVKIGIGAHGSATPWEGEVSGPLTDEELRASDVSITLDGEVVHSQRDDLGKTMVRGVVSLSASQSGVTVLDPTAGSKYVLTKLWLSCTADGACRFFDHTDDSAHAVGPAGTYKTGGGFMCDWQADLPLRSAAVDNILKYTSGAGFTGSVYYEGWEES